MEPLSFVSAADVFARLARGSIARLLDARRRRDAYDQAAGGTFHWCESHRSAKREVLDAVYGLLSSEACARQFAAVVSDDGPEQLDVQQLRAIYDAEEIDQAPPCIEVLQTLVHHMVEQLGSVVKRDPALMLRLERLIGSLDKEQIIEEVRSVGHRLERPRFTLPTDYAVRIQNFLSEYLGTTEHPVPFGGRRAALEDLDTWLGDADGPPYFLLAAPAGRGKSALLVRWSEALRARRDLAIVFIPVSIRFRTNLSTVTFAALASRLAALHGEEVQSDSSPEVWREMAAGYLSRPLPDGRRLLVILDGVDEAADWEPGPDLFPADPPRGLRVVVSARYLAGDVNRGSWLQRLGWERPGLAATFDLAPLTQEGIGDVLCRMGFPLDQLGERVHIVAELHRLSEGDPLLVRLYVDDLWERGEGVARLRPEELRDIHPGLEGYFDRWWEEQRSLWSERSPLREKTVQTLLNLLSCALGPLTREDVLRLAPPEVGLDTWTLEEALRRLERFVIGDGRQQGYVFSHPRLGAHFHSRLSGQEREEWEGRFLAWGRQTLEDLNAGRLEPKEASAYTVQYYGAHLERGGREVEGLFALVSDGWRRAWEALEGSYAGFLTDVERAWRVAERDDEQAIRAGSVASHIDIEVRCALCRASVNTLAGNIPPALLLAAVEKQVWTPAQALAYARQVVEPARRAELLARLAPHLTQPMLSEALDAARRIPCMYGYARARLLRALAAHLGKAVRAEVLREALDAARQIPAEYVRAEELTALAPHLAEPVLGEALAVARQIPGGEARVKALAALAPHLEEAVRAEVLGEALQATRQIGYDDNRVSPLDVLGLDLGEFLLGRGVDPARQIWHKSARVRALAALTPHLGDSLLREALYAAVQIPGEDDLAEALAALAPHLAELVLGEALDAARQISDERARARALAALAPQVTEALRGKVLGEALDAARRIPGEYARAGALAALAPRLSERTREEVLGEALEAAREIPDSYVRASLLRAVAPHLGQALRANVLEEALAAAIQIRYEAVRADVLIDLAPHLGEHLFEEALDAARQISDERARARALAALAPQVTEALRGEVLGEALAAAQQISAADDRVTALAGLAPHLGEHLFEEALDAARQISDERARARALAALAPHLGDSLLREALVAARQIWDEYARGQALGALAPHLGDSLLREALQTARQILDEYYRDEALAALVPHLGESVLGEALETARQISDEYCRAEALAALAPRLNEGTREEVLGEALEAARQISGEYDRVKALAALAPHLGEPLLGEALEAARQISDGYYRAMALAALAPHLGEPVPGEALEAARQISDERTREEALAAPAPNLGKPVFGEALESARQISDKRNLARALAALIPRLADVQPVTLYAEWQKTLRSLAGFGRQDVLYSLSTCAPILAKLARAKGVAGTCRAIRQVCSWWP